VAIFVFPVIFDGFFVEEVEDYFIDVELEAEEEEGCEEVTCFDLLRYFLNETHLVDFPLDCSSGLTAYFLLGGLLFSHFVSECYVLSDGRDCDPFFHIDFKYLHKEIIE